MAEDAGLLSAIRDSLIEEVVFVDTEHVVRYMNVSGKKHYAKYGELIGKSVFTCHNERSQEMIRTFFARLQAGEEEVLYAENDERRIYMRAVRDSQGQLIGYYERYVYRQAQK
jgi:DUF438 domain-containing protein